MKGPVNKSGRLNLLKSRRLRLEKYLLSIMSSSISYSTLQPLYVLPSVNIYAPILTLIYSEVDKLCSEKFPVRQKSVKCVYDISCHFLFF